MCMNLKKLYLNLAGLHIRTISLPHLASASKNAVHVHTVTHVVHADVIIDKVW